MQTPAIALVVAISENGVIGADGGLPWRLRSDLKMFRRLTLGHPVIMGRKTYQSLGRPLDQRDNIVISRQPLNDEGIIAAASPDEAIAKAAEIALQRGLGEIFIIGGAEIFAASLPLAQRIYLTRVHAVIEGDVFFPAHDLADWLPVSTQHAPAGKGDDFPHSFIVLERARFAAADER